MLGSALIKLRLLPHGSDTFFNWIIQFIGVLFWKFHVAKPGRARILADRWNKGGGGNDDFKERNFLFESATHFLHIADSSPKITSWQKFADSFFFFVGVIFILRSITPGLIALFFCRGNSLSGAENVFKRLLCSVRKATRRRACYVF